MSNEYIYEILIRGDSKGLQGAHIIWGRAVVDTDGDLHQKIGKAEPVSLQDLSGILDHQSALTVVQISKLTALVQELESANGKQSADLQKAINTIANQQQALVKATAELTLLQSTVQQLKTQLKHSSHGCSHRFEDPILVGAGV